ncbi:MAG TPA: NAD(P)H-dependent oxidoreductase [Streptosporangiaceae bacterium]|nr:NAD(P)H-dependent oxidoreductase [Streptosporangiaceae bacterium]
MHKVNERKRDYVTRIAILVGSTRPGRNGETVARWVYERAIRRDDATFEVVDIAKQDLPFLDEPAPAALDSNYRQEHTKRWSETIASFDGYVFVTPEYNHSICGALKNAIDFLYVEWHNKAAGFVGYGLQGAVRAVEQLRLVMGELHVADVRDQVALSLFTDFEDMKVFRPAAHHEPMLDRMLDEVVAWSEALAAMRQKAQTA